MALVLKDRVQETSTTTGTGTLTLAGAVTQFQTFSAAVGNGNTTYYTIYNAGGTEWEVGLGTVGAGTLARTTVLASSNAGAAVNFTGTLYVFGDYPADKAIFANAAGNIDNASLTSPKINEILDTNGNEILGFTPVTSATDYISLKNGIGVGAPLHILATGSSTNVGLHIEPKGTGLVTITDGTDNTKGIRFRSSGSATSAVTLLDAVSSAGHVITLPNATTTLVGRDTTDTLTNKTISGSTNTLSSIANASLTNSAITINGTSTSLGGSISVGSVTSVDLTASTGISVSGGPVTGSGSITVTNTLPMVYPGAGIPNSTGSAWGTSYTTSGTGTVVALATAPALNTPVVTNYTETLYAPAAGSAFTVSLSDGTVQKFSLNANGTITLPSSVSGKSFVIIVTYSGAFTLTWAGGSTIKWPGGTVPTASSANGKFDIFTFFCDGTNTYGNSFGLNY